MTIPIRDCQIDVYRNERTDIGDANPAFTIDQNDIAGFDIQARVDDQLDEATLTLHNHHSRYSIENYIETSDRLDVEIALGEPTRLDTDAWGVGVWGEGTWGSTAPEEGDAPTVRWTGRVLDLDRSRDQPGLATLNLAATDWVGAILADRTVTNAYIDEDIGAIIRDICRRKASEIDSSGVPDFGISTDVKYTSADCWDAVNQLAARADGLVSQDGLILRVDPIEDLGFALTLEPGDVFLPWTTTVDDTVKNIVRVDSGTARKVEREQTEVDPDSFERVAAGDEDTGSEPQRILYRLRARKAAVHSIELWTRRVSDEDSVEVRLQSDEGGAPVDIEDPDSDIASTRWEADNLTADGWTSFFFADHTLADRDPWLIIESDGETGHDIGHSAAGTLAYISYYPHPLNFEVVERDSVDRYGAREIQIERDNLETLVATRDAAQAELARRAWPSKTIEFAARSERAHALVPGEVIAADVPSEDAVGEYIVTERSSAFDGAEVTLDTAITAEWRRGILAPRN